VPRSTVNGFSGPLLFPPRDHPPAFPVLVPHVDDVAFLLQKDQVSTFEQRAQLLYLNWKVLHEVDALHDIKKWLESLSEDDHLLLVHLYAAYWVTTSCSMYTIHERSIQIVCVSSQVKRASLIT